MVTLIEPIFLAMGGVLAMVLAMLFSAWAPRVALVVGLLFYTLPLLQIGPGVDTRPILVVVAAGLLLRWAGTKPRIMRQANGLLLIGLVILLVTTALSLTWTVDIRQTMAAFSSTAIAFTLLWLSRSIFTSRDLLWCVLVASGSLVILSLIMGVSGIGTPTAGGRLRGIFSNANALGIMAMISTVSSVVIRRRWILLGYWAVVGVTLVWTASRAGAAAAALFIVIAAWTLFSDWRSRLVIIGILSLSFIQVLVLGNSSSSLEESTGLVRTNDSRSDYWFLALEDIRAGLPWGYGGGSASVQGEAGVNVFLKSAYEFGWWGVVMAAIILASIACLTRGSRFGVAAFSAIFVNVQFEGWLFTFGNSFTIMAFLVISALSGTRTKRFPMSRRTLEMAGMLELGARSKSITEARTR